MRVGLEGVRLHHRCWGRSGPRLLLLHAIGLDHVSWEPVAAELGRAAEVVAVDLPGHGASDKPSNGDYSLRSLGRRVIQFLDELGWEEAILVGNSLGGGTSLSVTIQAPHRVRALGLFDSVGYRWGLPPMARLGFLPVVAPAVCRFSPTPLTRLGLSVARHGLGVVPHERGQRVRNYLKDPHGTRAFLQTLKQLHGPDLDELAVHYPRIRQPALVVHGDSDLLVPPRHSEELAKVLPGARLAKIPRCGHFPQEEQPETALRLIRELLEEVSG
ncbi:MAG: alpha/beta hydrolase [Armatimonadetes bacterium]|nr:alpha/beta hydrolase [Armatimonadota bacterium]